jgi:hypothetical protein
MGRYVPVALSVPSTESTTTAGSAVGGFDNYDELHCVASLVGLAGGTLDVYVQESLDGGTTWFDVCHFPQLASGAAAIRYSFTVPRDSALKAVGQGTTPALAVNNVAGGPWGPQLRLLSVTGAGTSGDAKVQTLHCYMSKKAA